MYQNRYVETAHLVEDILDQWQKWLSDAERQHDTCFEYRLSNLKMRQGNIEFLITFSKISHSITIKAINQELLYATGGSFTEAINPVVLYEVTTHDNTKESLNFAIESLFYYLEVIALCKIATMKEVTINEENVGKE